MMFRIHVSLILLVLLIQVHKSSNNYCAESIKSIVTVSSCPTSKEKWNLAASKKHCETHALRQNCTHPTNYVYHCVINQYENEILEVCAQKRIIFGHCTAYNVGGGVIQHHFSAQCSHSAFPKCNRFYLSTEAYKYPDCYQLVRQRLDHTTSNIVNQLVFNQRLDHTTSSTVNQLLFNQRMDHTTLSTVEIKYVVIVSVSAVIAVFTASIWAVILFFYCKSK